MSDHLTLDLTDEEARMVALALESRATFLEGRGPLNAEKAAKYRRLLDRIHLEDASAS